MMKELALALSALLPVPALADVELPRESPGATLTEKIGTSTLTISYHRPAVKGRAIWGALVPYGNVWRLGANDATTITLTHDAKVAGKDVPKGTYALFAIPGKESWTLIVNKQPKQWGAYFHKPSEDLFRFDVKPTALAAPVEWLTFAIVPASPNGVRVEMAWEKVRIEFPVEVDVNRIVWADLDAALAAAKPDDWTAPFQAAKYARETKQRVDQAMGWLEKSSKIKETFWHAELKARLLADEGKVQEAIPLLEKARDLSKGKAPKEYAENLDKEILEWKKKS